MHSCGAHYGKHSLLWFPWLKSCPSISLVRKKTHTRGRCGYFFFPRQHKQRRRKKSCIFNHNLFILSPLGSNKSGILYQSVTRKFDSSTVPLKCCAEVYNFFKTWNRFHQGDTDGRCHNWLQSGRIRNRHQPAKASGNSFLSRFSGRRRAWLCLCVNNVCSWTERLYLWWCWSGNEPLLWVCSCVISSVLHSPSVSNLERFKHVLEKTKTKNKDSSLKPCKRYKQGWFPIKCAMQEGRFK